MLQTRKIFHLFGFALVFISLMVVSSVMAATSGSIELNAIRSNDCSGESVQLSGLIHFVSQTQPNGDVVGHFNYQAVTGLGLTSGTRYHVSAIDQFHLTAPFPSSIYSVRSFRLISEGGGDNLLVRVLFLITVNANGEIAMTIDELTTSCL